MGPYSAPSNSFSATTSTPSGARTKRLYASIAESPAKAARAPAVSPSWARRWPSSSDGHFWGRMPATRPSRTASTSPSPDGTKRSPAGRGNAHKDWGRGIWVIGFSLRWFRLSGHAVQGAVNVALCCAFDEVCSDLRVTFGPIRVDASPHHSVVEDHDDVHGPLAVLLDDLGGHFVHTTSR